MFIARAAGSQQRWQRRRRRGRQRAHALTDRGHSVGQAAVEDGQLVEVRLDQLGLRQFGGGEGEGSTAVLCNCAAARRAGLRGAALLTSCGISVPTPLSKRRQ